MPYIPVDDQSRHQCLQPRQAPEGLASAAPGHLAEDELEDLIEKSNAGDKEATQKLREFFGEGSGGGTFRRHFFKSVARALGVESGRDLWDARMDFERIEEGLTVEGGDFVDDLLAETTAFSHCVNQLAHMRMLDTDLAARAEPTLERALRQRSLNAHAANLSFLRTCRLLKSAPAHIRAADRHRQNSDLTGMRLKLLRAQLSRLRGHDGDPFGIDERDTGPCLYEVMRNPRVYGYETFEDWVFSRPTKRAFDIIEELAEYDNGRCPADKLEDYFRNRFPLLFSWIQEMREFITRKQGERDEPTPPAQPDPQPDPEPGPEPDPEPDSAPSPETDPDDVYYDSEKPVKPMFFEPAETYRPPQQPVPVDRFTRNLLKELDPPEPCKRR